MWNEVPAQLHSSLKERITKEIEHVISLSGLRNLSFNLEVMIDKSGCIYIMELGPCNGGNCMPEVTQNYAGVNMVALAVEAVAIILLLLYSMHLDLSLLKLCWIFQLKLSIEKNLFARKVSMYIGSVSYTHLTLPTT